MEKKIKHYLNFLFLLFFISFFASKSLAIENKKFLTLKNDEVNLRQGPSFKYPIKLIYKKKNLPVLILDKSETWRKITDFENNTGWLHISQLSRKKSAINIKNNSVIYKNATIYSKPVAKLAIGRLMFVKKCKLDWCKVASGGHSGWILKSYLWGKIK